MPAQSALLTNPFLYIMQRSHVGAVAICGHTAAVLDAQRGNPGIGPLNSMLGPIYAALAAAFAARIAAAGIQKGKTRSLADLLDDLSADYIDDWDFAIQQVHRKGTARYLELLPNGRAPFQKGRQAQRIAEVGALIERIGDEAALAELKTQVQVFYNTLTDAEAAQEGAKGTTESGSTALEAAVTAAAVGLFKVYGGLVQLFAEEPERIGEYYNMEIIIDREQRAFTGSVGISATRNIAKRTLEPTAQIRIVNSGPTDLRFYFAAEKNDEAPAGGGVLIPSGEDQTVSVSALGTGPFLNVRNESEAGAGSYQLVML